MSGFQTKQQALQFEWAVKHVAPRNKGGIAQRIQKLFTVLCKEKWTSKAVEANTVPLTVTWQEGNIPELYHTCPSYIQCHTREQDFNIDKVGQSPL